MLALTLAGGANRALSLLCLGAHADDIELGCGGTIAKLLAGHPGTRVHWLVLSASIVRAAEARAAAARLLLPASEPVIKVCNLPDGRFPTVYGEAKEIFEDLKARTAPDVIFTHRRLDAHQDHRTVAELTWNTFRDHLVLEYEIPKYDGDLGNPNLFVPLDRAAAEAKAALIVDCFASQRHRRWFDKDTFLGLMRLRGVQCAAPDGFAEAFEMPKAQFIPGV